MGHGLSFVAFGRRRAIQKDGERVAEFNALLDKLRLGHALRLEAFAPRRRHQSLRRAAGGFQELSRVLGFLRRSACLPLPYCDRDRFASAISKYSVTAVPIRVSATASRSSSVARASQRATSLTAAS